MKKSNQFFKRLTKTSKKVKSKKKKHEKHKTTQHVTKCLSAGTYMTCRRNQQVCKAWIFEAQ